MSAALKFDPAPRLEWSTSYDRFIGEAWPLIMRHWAEVGSHRDILRLDPDHARYRALEYGRRLHILTARARGRLVGYLFILLLPHPRDKEAILARDDIFFVLPEYRRLRLGLAMIEAALAYVDGKADLVMLTEKLQRTLRRGRPAGGYLARYGFEPQETIWVKVLRKPHGDPT